MAQSTFKTSVEEVLGEIQTLQLVHSFYLLFSLGSSLLKLLVLALYSVNFSLYFIFPAVPQGNLAFLVVGFEFPDLLEFSFFLNFE